MGGATSLSTPQTTPWGRCRRGGGGGGQGRVARERPGTGARSCLPALQCLAWGCVPWRAARLPPPPPRPVALCGRAPQQGAALGAHRRPRNQGAHAPRGAPTAAAAAVPLLQPRAAHQQRGSLAAATQLLTGLVQVDPGYAPFDEGLKDDVFVRGADGKPYLGWVRRSAGAARWCCLRAAPSRAAALGRPGARRGSRLAPAAQVWPGACHFPDFLHERGQRFFARQLAQHHKQVPWDAIWIDMDEIAK